LLIEKGATRLLAWSYWRRKMRQIEHCHATIKKARHMLARIDVAVPDTLLFLEDADAGY
jgi:hypothetical protein